MLIEDPNKSYLDTHKELIEHYLAIQSINEKIVAKTPDNFLTNEFLSHLFNYRCVGMPGRNFEVNHQVYTSFLGIAAVSIVGSAVIGPLFSILGAVGYSVYSYQNLMTLINNSIDVHQDEIAKAALFVCSQKLSLKHSAYTIHSIQNLCYRGSISKEESRSAYLNLFKALCEMVRLTEKQSGCYHFIEDDEVFLQPLNPEEEISTKEKNNISVPYYESLLIIPDDEIISSSFDDKVFSETQLNVNLEHYKSAITEENETNINTLILPKLNKALTEARSV